LKAQIINQFGDPSVFQLTEVAVPVLIPGHVLIKVHATSVNPVDCKIRSGANLGSTEPELPAILHGDVAGVIHAVAADVTQFKVGDEVYGCAGGVRHTGGALAEYMLADSKLLAKKPSTLSFLQAAALPLVTITAWEALFTRSNLANGETVLIHGGAGGVGHIAVQLAKWRGAKVVATVRKKDDIALVKSFGADEVINITEEKPADYVKRLTQGRGFDLVFDTIGGANLEISFTVAAINGTIATTVTRGMHDLSLMHAKGQTLHAVFMLLPLLTNHGREAHGKILAQAAEIVAQKQLHPLIDPHQFTLAETSQAHALMESGNAHGKVVIAIS